MRKAALALTTATVAALALAGCSSGHDTTASGAAHAIKAAVPSATGTTKLTKTNDGNKLLGKQNGYTAATVINDKSGKCDGGPGVACGAVVEQWSSADKAKTRDSYLTEVYSSGVSILGSEYEYRNGKLLLRVSGDLSKSKAKEYKAAFDKYAG